MQTIADLRWDPLQWLLVHRDVLRCLIIGADTGPVMSDARWELAGALHAAA